MAEEQALSRCPGCDVMSSAGGFCERCRERVAAAMPGSSPPESPPRSSGVVLEGKYRLLEELGRGGMGTVFRALDESLGRVVAVKFLLPEFQADQHFGARFLSEARAMASVRHESVVQIFSFGSYGTAAFFVMEYVEGSTAEKLLENTLERRVFLKLDRVLSILEQTAGGLAAVHRAGVVHRDVKPANLMVEAETGRVVIMDFGIGKRYREGNSQQTMSPAGSPAYMAPEVISGQRSSSEGDHLVDIYAFGVTAFELLTNTLPFDSRSWVDILVKHVTEPPPRPSSRRLELPPELDEIVLRCLAKSPADRYRSCDELQQALLRLIPCGSVSRALTPVPAKPERRRRPSVPARPEQPSDTVRQAALANGARETRHVIVTDEDPAFRKMAFELVEEAMPWCSFQATKTNAKALELALAVSPLLMVARLDDPVLNGLELAASLHGHPKLAEVLLVLTSERIAAAERRILSEFGAHRVLLKPIAPSELSTVLNGVARRLVSRPSPGALAAATTPGVV